MITGIVPNLREAQGTINENAATMSTVDTPNRKQRHQKRLFFRCFFSTGKHWDFWHKYNFLKLDEFGNTGHLSHKTVAVFTIFHGLVVEGCARYKHADRILSLQKEFLKTSCPDTLEVKSYSIFLISGSVNSCFY